MPPTYFKFTTPDGLNRRLTFSELPTWPFLASKLHVLYGIALDKVAVSYVDNDNDEIIVSSDEELQDFYKASYQVGQVIKFSVLVLHSSQNNARKPLEFPSLSQNPFDIDAFEFVGEWERPPTILATEKDRSQGPHAFVEVLSSNNSVAHDHAHEVDADTEDDHSTVQPPLLDKGKGRAFSFGAASITSVLEEEISHKHPIHVYDLNSRKDDKGKDNGFGDPPVHIHVAAQSTPKVQAKNLSDSTETKEAPLPSKVVQMEDPPLPSLDEPPTSATSTSLLYDLTSLVHDVTQVVSSHPELSEGLRNIGRNISNGTYWTTHHEALSKAVDGMSNPPLTERRQAEEAAARRLTDVVGNFFRTLSQVPATTEDTDTCTPNINEGRDQSRDGNPPHATPPWHPMNTAFGWALQGMRAHDPSRPMPELPLRGSHYSPYGPFPPHGPHVRPHNSPMLHGRPHNGRRPTPHMPPPFPFHLTPRPGPPPPPPPPPAPPGPRPPPPHHASPPAHPSLPPGVQGHISPPPSRVPLPNGSPVHAQPDIRSSDIQSRGHSVNDRRRSYQGPFAPFLHVSAVESHSPLSKPNAQDLRAQVEAAKRLYKAEKERYRQEREQRRREKLTRKPTVRDDASVAQAGTLRQHEIPSSQFQNIYPELERVSVPRRSNTHLGHGPFRHVDKKPEDLTSRAVARVAKKLSDMGFSENAYPSLPEKIKAQMPPNGVISKEVEDDVVTTLLEEFLATASPRPNVTSGSG